MTPRHRRRWHLFEFGDQVWLPAVLRDAETAYLVAAYRLVPIARVWAEKMRSTLNPGDQLEILDLGSGAGGPLPQLLDELEKNGCKARAKLSDLFPSGRAVRDPRMEWIEVPVDATQVPPSLTGVRTMFSALHHFRPAAARAILQDAFNCRRSICIFESGSGGAVGVATMLLVPLNVLAMMLLTRPLRWEYLLFTYIIPILPLMVFWDGVVSMLRIYPPDELQALTEGLEAPDYLWENGRIRVRGIPGGLPFLIGRHADREESGKESL